MFGRGFESRRLHQKNKRGCLKRAAFFGFVEKKVVFQAHHLLAEVVFNADYGTCSDIQDLRSAAGDAAST